jgi:DNA-binding MarR family transcriptional regulator
MNGTDSESATTESATTPEPQGRRAGLGRALRQAWVGYHRRLDLEMAAAGFEDRGFPDGRVLRICSRSGETTISQIGRELGITRQGAGKLVASLRDRQYVTVEASTSSGREKTVKLTPRAIDYLVGQRKAVRRIERQVRADLGAENFDALISLLHALGGEEQPRMLDYLRKAAHMDSLRDLED